MGINRWEENQEVQKRAGHCHGSHSHPLHPQEIKCSTFAACLDWSRFGWLIKSVSPWPSGLCLERFTTENHTFTQRGTTAVSLEGRFMGKTQALSRCILDPADVRSADKGSILPEESCLLTCLFILMVIKGSRQHGFLLISMLLICCLQKLVSHQGARND